MVDNFMHAQVSVVKLGGSLLTLPDLGDRLHQLLQRMRPDAPVVLAGGGILADQIRQLDQIHPWPDTVSHELAIRTLSVTAHVVANLDHLRFAVVESLSDAENVLRNGRWPVLDPVPWLCSQQDRSSTRPKPPSTPTGIISANESLESLPLPPGWHVTSDSIAAQLAAHGGSGRLLLVKSTDLPHPSPTIQWASDQGLVDDYFPHVAKRLKRIDWINLLDSCGEIQTWCDLGDCDPGQAARHLQCRRE